MKVKAVLGCAAVLAVGVLLLAGNARAQWTGSVKVSGIVEPSQGNQNEGGVTAARCGNNVVVGFGDSETGNNVSFDGYAISSNGGATFRDLGVLPVSAQSGDFGRDNLGDRAFGTSSANHSLSLACANSNVFYYASEFLSNNTPDLCPGFPICSAISVSISRDGGATWSLPVVAAAGSIDTHALSTPSVAVDPTNSERVYVAYLLSNATQGELPPDCQSETATEVRLAISADGGKIWTDELVDHACDLTQISRNYGTLASPKVLISPGGKVYMTYEFLADQNGPGTPVVPNEIRFTRSLNDGATFSTPIVVSKDAISNGLPQIAVDRTSSTHIIYLTWSGSPTGTYTDVLVSDSLNYGLSFSFPRPISAAPAAGTGRFQTSPVLAVDNDRQVAVCFYATPSNTPTSTSVYSYSCATSFNRAASWTVQRLASSAPVGYDAVTSDFLLHNDGFFTAFDLQVSGQRHVVGEKSDNP